MTTLSENKNSGKIKEIIVGIWLLPMVLLWVFYVLSEVNLIIFGFAFGVTLLGPVLEAILVSKGKNSTNKKKGNPLGWLVSLGCFGFLGFLFSPFNPLFLLFFLFFLVFIPYNGEKRKENLLINLALMGIISFNGPFWRPYAV